MKKLKDFMRNQKIIKPILNPSKEDIHKNFRRAVILMIYVFGLVCAVLIVQFGLSIHNDVVKLRSEAEDRLQQLQTLKGDVSKRSNEIKERDKRIAELESRIEAMEEENEKFREEIKEETERTMSQFAAKKKMEEQYAINLVMSVQSNDGHGAFTPYTDLYTSTPLSAEELDIIINDIRPKVMRGLGTPFTGEMFYKAWEVTGLDPRYLLAHAGNESGWGNFHHGNKYQMYGIGVWDTNPEYGLDHGDSVEEGIINGAIWIKENYYDHGYITMYMMGDRGYCTGSYWYNTISGTANNFSRVIARVEDSTLALL